MSVSFQKIIRQMKKEINSIDSNTSEEMIRAKVYSIQSLATLITEFESTDNQVVRQMAELTDPANEPQNFSLEEAEAKVMGVHPNKSSEGKKIDQGERLREDDANGDSIFDF